jgi:hypothetical protein
MNNKYEIKQSHLNIIYKAVLGRDWKVKSRVMKDSAYVEIADYEDQIIANGAIGDYVAGDTSEDLLTQIMEGLSYWASLHFENKKV